MQLPLEARSTAGELCRQGGCLFRRTGALSEQIDATTGTTTSICIRFAPSRCWRIVGAPPLRLSHPSPFLLPHRSTIPAGARSRRPDPLHRHSSLPSDLPSDFP
jgi:hypothetical protein